MSFELAFKRLMLHEGGLVNNPADPGGETKWGISKRAYPSLNIAALTKTDAMDIYRKDYWTPVHADELPFSIAFQVFDFAVNSGVGTAIRHLQRAVDVADDGKFGPVTRSAVEQANEACTVMRLLSQRLDFMTRLLNWQNAGKGWSRRIAKNMLYGAEDQRRL